MQPENGFLPGFWIVIRRRVVPHGALPAGFAQMVIDFMAKNADKPGPLRRLATEFLTRLYGSQECLLHQVLGDACIPHLANGKIEKIIGVGIHPIAAQSWLALTVPF